MTIGYTVYRLYKAMNVIWRGVTVGNALAMIQNIITN